ncbi:LacI family DNA-binding transcriptional regulator [Algihabitans albus]|uniref:LacI family DNA-binding transcriptional regulator n=1 Tax=Algihabitans albus TaxID=2164067 RepID=UPI000E5CFFC5|nr:LacI family DNA-binding transcriptional regulator [Algihabitans albus]
MSARDRDSEAGSHREPTARRATLKDVAERAGVDKSTASRLLRGVGQLTVREETRERVFKAAEDLRYKPNQIAQSLRSSRSRSLGIVVPQVINPVYAQIIVGASNTARERGYMLLISQTGDSSDTSVYDQLVNQNRVDGLLVATLRDEAAQMVALKALDVPFVLVNRQGEASANYVMCDEVDGASRATTYLIERGHRRIAHLAGEQTRFNAKMRLEGYRRALEEAGIAYDPGLVATSGYDQRGGERAMQQILDTASPLPTAVFVVTLVAAAGAMATVHKAGLEIPRDISFLSFHNGSLADMLYPPLTTLEVPVEQIAARATEGLIEILEDRRETIEVVVPAGDVVDRQSVATLKAARKQA